MARNYFDLYFSDSCQTTLGLRFIYLNNRSAHGSKLPVKQNLKGLYHHKRLKSSPLNYLPQKKRNSKFFQKVWIAFPWCHQIFAWKQNVIDNPMINWNWLNFFSPFQPSIFFRCSGDRFSIFRSLFWILIITHHGIGEIFSVTQPETNWGGLSSEPGDRHRH